MPGIVFADEDTRKKRQARLPRGTTHRTPFPFMDIATEHICLVSSAGGYHLATVTSASMNIPVQRVLNFKFFKNIFF